jgi:hypothetical protein
VILCDAHGGALESALSRFATAIEMSGTADPYPAIWLVVTCGEQLAEIDPVGVRTIVSKMTPAVSGFEYAEMMKRFAAVSGRASLGVESKNS